MNFKFKALAAAAVMVVAGQASAALSDTFVTSGTLFLTVWDVNTNKSYVRDLGVDLDNFLPGASAKTPEAGLNQVFANLPSSTLFATQFGASSSANIRWTVVGVDGIEGEGAGNGSRSVSAFGSNPGTIVNGSVRGFAALAINFAGDLNQNTNVGEFGEYGSTGTTATDGGGTGWGGSIAGVGLPGAIVSGFGSAGFYLGATSNDTSDLDPSNASPMVRFANSLNFATMTLGSDGALTYNLEPALAAVPVPAAAWLMGAGLVAFGGAMRRRKAAAAAA